MNNDLFLPDNNGESHSHGSAFPRLPILQLDYALHTCPGIRPQLGARKSDKFGHLLELPPSYGRSVLLGSTIPPSEPCRVVESDENLCAEVFCRKVIPSRDSKPDEPLADIEPLHEAYRKVKQAPHEDAEGCQNEEFLAEAPEEPLSFLLWGSHTSSSVSHSVSNVSTKSDAASSSLRSCFASGAVCLK